MKSTVITLLLLSLSSSFSQSVTPELDKWFSLREIQELNIIADFFQSQICGDLSTASFADCYRQALPDIMDLKRDYIGETINYADQIDLYQSLSESTINKIWTFCTYQRVNEPDREWEQMCISDDPAISGFICDTGKSNRYYKTLCKKLNIIQEFNDGYLETNIKENPRLIDLEDRNVQILLSINYLTQNDIKKRDKKLVRVEKKKDN